MDQEVTIGEIKVKVLKDVCIGAATCVAIAPSVFELDENMKARVINGANDTKDNIINAAQGCPVKAIIITDAKTGEQIWPK